MSEFVLDCRSILKLLFVALPDEFIEKFIGLVILNNSLSSFVVDQNVLNLKLSLSVSFHHQKELYERFNQC